MEKLAQVLISKQRKKGGKGAVIFGKGGKIASKAKKTAPIAKKAAGKGLAGKGPVRGRGKGKGAIIA